MQSEPPVSQTDQRERDRRRLERVLPELIKRVLDVGYGKISEGSENVRDFVSELKLPKEVLSLLVAQIDETKNGLYRVVAREIRDFLEHTNVSEELSKVLTTLSLEIKTEVRFRPNQPNEAPDVQTEVKVKREPSSPPADEPDSTEGEP